MTQESRRVAGILLLILPGVMYGGVSILRILISDPTYMQNPLRQDLWRAGHAHAGVWLILALVALRYVDEANLSNAMKWLVRGSIPAAAILVPAAFFLSVVAQRCWPSACSSLASASSGAQQRGHEKRTGSRDPSVARRAARSAPIARDRGDLCGLPKARPRRGRAAAHRPTAVRHVARP